MRQILTIDKLKKKLKNINNKIFFNSLQNIYCYLLIYYKLTDFYRVKCLILFLLESVKN